MPQLQRKQPPDNRHVVFAGEPCHKQQMLFRFSPSLSQHAPEICGGMSVRKSSVWKAGSKGGGASNGEGRKTPLLHFPCVERKGEDL